MLATIYSAATADRLCAGWEALGTGVVLQVTDPGALGPARAAVERELLAIDSAASRFRADSDLERCNRAGGRRLDVSPLLVEALEAAIRAAVLTDGAVDPTLGDALILAGYTSDWRRFDAAPADPSTHQPAQLVVRARPARAWEAIDLHRDPPSARFGGGVRVDLGATAKALAADRAARAAADIAGGGILVSLGGDIATAGTSPESGWLVRVTDDHRAGADAPGQTVRIASGGLATSSTTVRRWVHGGRSMHHILDPRDGQPVARTWRTASVAAATCIDANIASTAAIVLGSAAAGWLTDRNLPARLVAHDGRIETIGDWPAEESGL
ncbi:MAG TPA: FAD:protein FMN transferase [Solirubrobacteraceae bacterium]|nr:FAD:protein FMN transferase [Solirubrobacteraceae bacterium]